jgi:hypothetical protein
VPAALVIAVCRPQVPHDARSAASLNATVTPATGAAELVSAFPVTVISEVLGAGEVVDEGGWGGGEDAVPQAAAPPHNASDSPAAAAALAIFPGIMVMLLPSWSIEVAD